MKIASLIFGLFLPLGISAQIILTQANVPAPGDTLFYARDTFIDGINLGTAGPDQSWDFSQLEVDESYQLIASDAAEDPEAELFPAANLVMASEEVKTFVESTDTAVYILGGEIPEAAAFGLGGVPFVPPQKIFQLPATFGTTFTNTYGLQATVDGSLLFPGIDSLRVIRRAAASVEVDAYGTVKTPFNNYQTLRQKTETINMDSVYAYYLGLWRPFFADTSMSIQYEWLAAETKGRVVTAFVDAETGLIESIEFFLGIDNANAPIASFSYDDQGEGTFAFTDQSGNSPSSWQWTFGDGSSSDEQNPMYTYSVGGSYQVCLTVTNLIGSNEVCQTISVDLVNATVDPEHRIYTRIFPNPANRYVYFRPEGFSQTRFTVIIFNSQGGQIAQRQFNEQLRLEVSDLPAGLYTYFLMAGDNQKWSSGKIHITH